MQILFIGNKYDYSKVEFNSTTDHIKIICPEHGEFKQELRHHLYGQGCSKCSFKLKNKINSLSDFIKRAKEVHGDKYDYSKVDLINRDKKGRVCIICPIHGEFWQTPSNHLKGFGCNFCSKPVHNTETFIKRAKEVHGDKYDYSKVEYVNTKTKVCIICPIHGEFWQTPGNFLKGEKCPKCANINGHFLQSMNTETFIKRAKEIHGDKYDYSKVKCINYNSEVCIICKEHGEFWQTPLKHLSKHGCKICKESHLEKDIRLFLEKHNITYVYQANKKNFKWLGKLTFDFYLPEYNIAIECQGEQHYKCVDFGFNDKKKSKINFLLIKERDIRKKILCEKNNINLIYYTSKHLKKNDEFTSCEEIFNYLIEYGKIS